MRNIRALALVAWGTTVASCAAAALVTAAAPHAGGGEFGSAVASALVFPLPFGTVGLVIAIRRSGNPIGWCYLASGLCFSVLGPWGTWVEHLVRVDEPMGAGALAVALTGNVIWAPAIACGITLPALLLPDGRLPSPRWRWVVRSAFAGVVLLVAFGNLLPGPLNAVAIENPVALEGLGGQAATVLVYTGDALYYGALPAALVCVVLRFRGSRGTERQQLRWAAFGAVAAVVALLTAMVLPSGSEDVVIPLAALSPPLATAVAVLRYRLWELDRLVSRTVTYLLLTGLLLVPYVALAPAMTRLAGNGGDLVVAGVTLAGAALFQPLRRRVQGAVDRRFNRKRYDAAHTIEAFSARLRQEIDLESLRGELLDVVDRAVQPERITLWLAGQAGTAYTTTLST